MGRGDKFVELLAGISRALFFCCPFLLFCSLSLSLFFFFLFIVRITSKIFLITKRSFYLKRVICLKIVFILIRITSITNHSRIVYLWYKFMKFILSREFRLLARMRSFGRARMLRIFIIGNRNLVIGHPFLCGKAFLLITCLVMDGLG